MLVHRMQGPWWLLCHSYRAVHVEVRVETIKCKWVGGCRMMENALGERYKGEQRSLNNLGKCLPLGREERSTRDADKHKTTGCGWQQLERRFGMGLLRRRELVSSNATERRNTTDYHMATGNTWVVEKLGGWCWTKES